MKQVFNFAIGLSVSLALNAFAQTTTGPAPVAATARPVTGLAPNAVSGFAPKPVSGFTSRPVSGFSQSPVTGFANQPASSPITTASPLSSPISGNNPLARPNVLTPSPNVVVVPQTRLAPARPVFTTGTNRILTPLF